MAANKSDKPKQKVSFKEGWQAIWGPYSQLLPYLKPYWKRFALGLVAGAGYGVVGGLLGLVIKHVTDYVFGSSGMSKTEMVRMAAEGKGRTIEAVAWTCAAIPAVMILRSILSYTSTYCMSWVSLKLLVDIRTDLFSRLMTQSLDFFNKNRAGQLIQRVANDTRMAQAALTAVS